MNQQIKTSLGVAIIIIFAATIGFFAWKSMETKEDSAADPVQVKNGKVRSNDKACTDEAKQCPDGSLVGRVGSNCEFTACPEKNKTGSEINSIDGKWDKYTNYNLGFSVNIPKLIPNKDNPKNGSKVKIFESGNVVYFYPEFNEKDESSSEYAESLKKLKNPSLGEFKKVEGIPWAILKGEAKDESALLSFIKQRYGSDCKLKNKNKLANGDFNLEVETTGTNGNCFLNFNFYIIYSPEKGRVFAWDTGQAPNFWITKFGDGTDEKMSESFKIIK